MSARSRRDTCRRRPPLHKPASHPGTMLRRSGFETAAGRWPATFQKVFALSDEVLFAALWGHLDPSAHGLQNFRKMAAFLPPDRPSKIWSSVLLYASISGWDSSTRRPA